MGCYLFGGVCGDSGTCWRRRCLSLRSVQQHPTKAAALKARDQLLKRQPDGSSGKRYSGSLKRQCRALWRDAGDRIPTRGLAGDSRP